jgi:hypothetical protein
LEELKEVTIPAKGSGNQISINALINNKRVPFDLDRLNSPQYLARELIDKSKLAETVKQVQVVSNN